MLSRIADALYWTGRYLERVDNTARLVEINLLHLLEVDDTVAPETHWRPLLGISNTQHAYAALYPDGAITGERVIRFLTQERTNPNSIRMSLARARDNARVVRDRISKEMWEIMNELWLRAAPYLDRTEAPNAMVQFCRFVRNEVARYHGVTVATMMRGEAFGFHHLGTFMERADMTSRILDVKYHLLLPALSLVGSALDYYQWAALLKSLSAFEAYRRTHHAGFSPAAVADFVILHPDFPRALRFSLDRAAQALAAIDGDAPPSPAALAIARMRQELATTEPGTIFDAGLHEFLTSFIEQLAEADRVLHATLFHGASEVPCAT